MGELSAWALSNRATVAEARHRYAQFAALCGIASIPVLRKSLVLKGGNAIDFAWLPNRSTRDLDFSLDGSDDRQTLVEEEIRRNLDRAFRIATARFGIVFAINSVRPHPPGIGKSFITYETRVGYGLPDQPDLLVRMRINRPSPHLLPIEISINDPVCETALFTLDDEFPQLRIGTIEEIVSEKLRALLQQAIRNRYRKQDILDIAVLVRANPDLNAQKISAFLQTKAAARSVPVSKSAFNDRELVDRARLDYDELEDTTRSTFIPFDEAMATVFALVAELTIPAGADHEPI